MGIQGQAFVIWLLFAHFIADFVCQTHGMATNKSKNWVALGAHVFVYDIVVTAGVILLSVAFHRGNPMTSVWFYYITGAAHFATDAITSRITAKLWAAQRVHDFFVVVGLDQWIHATTLIVTARWLGLL